MLVTTFAERAVVIEEGKVISSGKVLTDEEMLRLKCFDLIKLRHVSTGNYYTAYVIDELEMYLRDHVHAYEHFFFMLEVITEILIRRDAIISINTLIEYMMRDIKSFKERYENARSITQLISEIYLDCEMII